MFINTLLLGFALIQFSNCTSPERNTGYNDTEIEDFCKSFTKAICLKDTTLFYTLVDKERLTNSMNTWINDGKKFTERDVFFPFFFIYGPLKIRFEDLINERHNENIFSNFKIARQDKIDETNIRLSLEWTLNFLDASPQKIELVLKRSDKWKVVAAKWEMAK